MIDFAADPEPPPARHWTGTAIEVPAAEAPATIADALKLSFPSHSRVPLDCEDLLEPSVLSKAMGVPAGEINLAPRSPFYDMEEIAMAQAGLLSCEWEYSVEVAPGQTTTEYATVEVLPDARAQFHSYEEEYRSFEPQWERDYPDEPATLFGLVGDDSLLSCDPGDPGAPRQYQSCWGSLEESGYWVDFRFTSHRPVSDLESQENLGILVGTSLHGALASAGRPLDVNVLPKGSARAWDSCTAIEGAGELKHLSGSPTLTLRREYSGVEWDASIEALRHSPYQDCYWSQSAFPDSEYDRYACDDCDSGEPYVEPAVINGELAYLDVTILSGGEWGWHEIKDQESAMDAADIALIGAWDATSYCASPSYGSCDMVALVDHSIVRLDFGYYEEMPEDLDLTPRALQIMKYLLSQLNYRT